MKKVFFGFLAIGVTASLVVVMSCGGSGGEAANANSTVAGAAVSACLAGTGNPYDYVEFDEVNINSEGPFEFPITIDYDCPQGGTLTGTGQITVTVADTSATISGSITETMNDCTITDTACDFEDVVGNGTLTISIDGSGSQEGTASFVETAKGTLSFEFKGKTLECPVDLTLNVVNATEAYTQDGLVDAMTGTICSADWANVKAALADSAKMTELCTAFDAAATNI